ncbi:MAG: universal stress protein [Archaeoglobaceae archaeon]
MFERVLYPIDFTDVSITCARALTELKRYGAKELTLFHAIEYDSAKLIEGGIADVDKFLANLKEKANKKLEEIVKELSREFSSVSAKVTPTLDPTVEIAKMESEFDLLVIPSRSRSPLFLGKTAEKVVRSSKIPCLVVKSRPDAGKSYYELVFRNMFERPVFIVEKTIDDLAKVLESLRHFGLKKTKIVRIAELEEALERKVSKEEIIHPLVPIPRIAEILSEYWENERVELEKIRRYLETKGISSEVLISFGSLEKYLEKISKVEGLSLVVCGKQSFDKALKVADAVFVTNF